MKKNVGNSWGVKYQAGIMGLKLHFTKENLVPGNCPCNVVRARGAELIPNTAEF